MPLVLYVFCAAEQLFVASFLVELLYGMSTIVEVPPPNETVQWQIQLATGFLSTLAQELIIIIEVRIVAIAKDISLIFFINPFFVTNVILFVISGLPQEK